MSSEFVRGVVMAALVSFSTPAVGETSGVGSLGFRFADIAVGAVPDGRDVLGRAGAVVDFAITDVHGLQVDMAAVGYQGEFLGQVDGHLYMMPNDAAKYGLYFSVADMDGREATIASVGVEGMFAVSASTLLHGRAGIGMAMPGNVDFITLTFGASHALSDKISIFGDVTLAEFDEADLRAVGTTAQFGVSYQPESSPWELSATVARDGLTGRDSATFKTRAELAFTWHLGAGGGTRRGLAGRGFASPQPFDPLLRRGLF